LLDKSGFLGLVDNAARCALNHKLNKIDFCEPEKNEAEKKLPILMRGDIM
jgi:hypothetical protein